LAEDGFGALHESFGRFAVGFGDDDGDAFVAADADVGEQRDFAQERDFETGSHDGCVKHEIAFLAVFVHGNSMTFKRITCDPKRMNGQPCIRQLRLTVRRVVEAVATYPDRRDLQREFPELEAEDIREALAYAAANLDDKVIDLATAG
jgi:uncharacterized protein (DUF433 family)